MFSFYRKISSGYHKEQKMLNRILTILVSVVFVFSTSVAIADDHADHNDQSKTSSSAKVNSKDSVIVSFLEVLNQNEIDAGKEALQKSNNAEVKDYAELMVKAHTDNLDETTKLADKLGLQKVDTGAVKALEMKGKKTMKKLSSATDKTFDKVYVEDMVKGHEDALKSVQRFIKQTSNADLKAHLEATANAIKDHLETIKKIQSNMHKA